MVCIDMKMPDSCSNCPLLDDSGDYPYCRALHETRGYTFNIRAERFSNCPLKDQDKENEKHHTILEQYDTALAVLYKQIEQIKLLEEVLSKRSKQNVQT